MKADRSWLLSLQPSDPSALSRAVSDPELVNEVIARVGMGAAGWAVETSRAMPSLDVDSATVDEVRHDEFPTARRIGEALTLAIVTQMGGQFTLPASVVREALRAIREVLPRGFSSAGVLQGVQRVHAEVVHRLFDFCETEIPEQARGATMRRIAEDLFRGMDVLTVRVAQEFAAERERWLAGKAAQRKEAAERLLDGENVDPNDLSRQLDYDPTVHHLALILWSEEGKGGDVGELEDAARAMLASAGCSSFLLISVGTSRLWAWGGRVTGAPAPPREVVPPRLPAGTHLASGVTGAGVVGFRRSHEQALAAERTGRAVLPASGPVCDYETLEPVILLGADHAAAGEFVRRELGGMADPGPAMAELRATVKAYFDHDRSVTAASQQLHVAKNTVLYRVKKAESLRGRPFRDGRLRLHLALELAGVLGPVVLEPGPDAAR